jgi:putative membrane protein
MLQFVVHLILSAALLMIVANFVSGFRIESWGAAIFAALVLGLVNAVVRPLLVLLTLPLTIVTLGLFLVVINAFMLQIAAALVPGFRIDGFGPALIATVVLTLLGVAINSLLGPSA